MYSHLGQRFSFFEEHLLGNFFMRLEGEKIPFIIRASNELFKIIKASRDFFVLLLKETGNFQGPLPECL